MRGSTGELGSSLGLFGSWFEFEVALGVTVGMTVNAGSVDVGSMTRPAGVTVTGDAKFDGVFWGTDLYNRAIEQDFAPIFGVGPEDRPRQFAPARADQPRETKHFAFRKLETEAVIRTGQAHVSNFE